MGDQRDIIKIKGKLAHTLVEISQEFYGPYITYENGKGVLYLELLKELYGMLIASLLLYQKLGKDLESNGFKVNTYDPCVSNNMIRDKK